MMHIAALAAPVLLHRTSQYDSVRASLLPCTAHHLETPVSLATVLSTVCK